MFPIHVYTPAVDTQDVDAKQKNSLNHGSGHILCKNKKQTPLRKQKKAGCHFEHIYLHRQIYLDRWTIHSIKKKFRNWCFTRPSFNAAGHLLTR